MNMNKHIPAICAEILVIILLFYFLSRFTEYESIYFMMILFSAVIAIVVFVLHIVRLMDSLSDLAIMKKKQDEKGTEEEKHTGKEISKGTSIITLEDLESALIKLGYKDVRINGPWVVFKYQDFNYGLINECSSQLGCNILRLRMVMGMDNSMQDFYMGIERELCFTDTLTKCFFGISENSCDLVSDSSTLCADKENLKLFIPALIKSIDNTMGNAVKLLDDKEQLDKKALEELQLNNTNGKCIS